MHKHSPKAMDEIHMLLNIAFHIFLLIVAPILPFYLLFKSLLSSLKSLSKEEVAGKVVLITGASSGIGEHLAYEYARKGACLVLVARRKNHLQRVGSKARKLGSPDVLVIPADVSKLDDCKHFVNQTVNHFGRLDHLVNNAGIGNASLFEDYVCVSNHASAMVIGVYALFPKPAYSNCGKNKPILYVAFVKDINFWGSVYCTQFALPHLRKTRGKIVVIASAGAWFCQPRLTIYNATKGALISFYETLRSELGSEIGITIVNPGMIESEIRDEEFMSTGNIKFVPVESTEGCAKAVVNSTIRGDKYLTEPAWMNMVLFWKLLCPEEVDFFSRLIFGTEKKTYSQNEEDIKEILRANMKSLNWASI